MDLPGNTLVERVPYVYIISYVKSRECPMSLMCSECIIGPLVSRYKQTKMTNTWTRLMKIHTWYVCVVIVLAAKYDAVNSITASEIKREVEVNKYVLVLFSK